MAEDINLTRLSSLTNQTTVINAINNNSTTVEEAFQDVLSRSGTSPNQMEAVLDMNSNRIINLPAPVGLSDPLRLQDAATTLQIQILTSASNTTSNTVYAGPSSGTAGLPSFRSLVAADLPSPLNGTSQTANTFYAAPATGAGSPTFRAISVKDFNNGIAASANTFLKGDGTWGPGGSVTGLFDVTAYGATGNGSTDDTAAITTAAAAAMVAGGTLYFPEGTYIISNANALAINSGSGIVIQGCGTGSIIKAAPNANLTSLVFNRVPMTIQNIVLDGNRANNGVTGSSSSVLNLGSHGRAINCEIRFSSTEGISVGDGASPSDILIQGCYIHDNGGVTNSSGHGTGIISFGALAVCPEDVRVIGNRIESNYNTVTNPGPSAAINVMIKKLLFSDNYCKNNFNIVGAQVAIGDSADGSNELDFIISNNIIVQTTTFGGDQTFGIEAEASKGIITGNICLSPTIAGISIGSSASGVLVDGNVIQGAGATGIQFIASGGTGPNRSAIRNNHILSCATGIGLQTSATGSVVVENNYIDSTVTTALSGVANADVVRNNFGYSTNVGATTWSSLQTFNVSTLKADTPTFTGTSTATTITATTINVTTFNATNLTATSPVFIGTVTATTIIATTINAIATATASTVIATNITATSVNIIGTATASTLTATTFNATSINVKGNAQTFPSGAATLAAMNIASTWSSVQTFASGDLTATSPTFTGTITGASATLSSTLTFTGTGNGIVGSIIGDSANTGNVGEFISSSVVFGSAVPLVSNTASNVTSINLTAGDWDCSGNVGYALGGSTIMTAAIGWISSTSATLPATSNSAEFALNVTFQTGQAQLIPVGTIRFSLSTTTTIYLSGQSAFTASSNAIYGSLRARRMR